MNGATSLKASLGIFLMIIHSEQELCILIMLLEAQCTNSHMAGIRRPCRLSGPIKTRPIGARLIRACRPGGGPAVGWPLTLRRKLALGPPGKGAASATTHPQFPIQAQGLKAPTGSREEVMVIRMCVEGMDTAAAIVWFPVSPPCCRTAFTTGR